MVQDLIVITGSSSGIGLATARRFSALGHPLLLISRRGDHSGDRLPNALYCKLDILDFPTLQKAVAEAEIEFGPVGLIVNNAGLLCLGQFHTQSLAEWEQMIDVNVKGVLHGVRAVLPGMRERKRGTIINISSIAGRKPFPGHGVYCASKFAVHGLTEVLRNEVAGEGIRCVTVAPGMVDTDILDQTRDERLVAAYQRGREMVGKRLDPEDVADLIVYAYQAPQHVCLRELVICPTGQRE